MKILFFVPRDVFQRKMSRVRFHTLRYLSKLVELVYWGPGWNGYNNLVTLAENLGDNFFEVIIVYKPIKLGDLKGSMICIQYNEMWDIPLTMKEIKDNRLNLIICHHENDMVNYIGAKFPHRTFFKHIPHCADPDIFYCLDGVEGVGERNIDVLLIGSIGRHYPLRRKMKESLKLFNSKYVVKEFVHPGYLHDDSFTDKYLKDISAEMQNTKICLTCSSTYKYALGKYVEAYMCGCVVASDIPNQDNYRDFCIEILDSDTPEEICAKVESYLENIPKLIELREKGIYWANLHTHESYAKLYMDTILENYNRFRNPKMYVMGEELRDGTKWICDWFKEEVYENCKCVELVTDVEEADIIWLIAPWSMSKLKCDLSKKYVISTIHHIDPDKYSDPSVMERFHNIESVTNKFHTICAKTSEEFMKISKKDYFEQPFWANDLIYRKLDLDVREKWKIPKFMYVIGSFQKDSEGRDVSTPKLCKGPDIFIKIIMMEKVKHGDNLLVLLSGWKRNYIIAELEKIGVKYLYYEMVDRYELNELYNCLDLYIVSSRIEGGPMAIYECACSKTPIISTKVGISENILPPESFYSIEKIEDYSKAITNIYKSYKNCSSIFISKGYIDKFITNVIL